MYTVYICTHCREALAATWDGALLGGKAWGPTLSLRVPGTAQLIAAGGPPLAFM